MGCKTVDNTLATNNWLNSYYWINQQIKNGKTCGPTGTLTQTSGGQRGENTCIPPAPISTKTYCGRTYGFLSAGMKKKMQDSVNALFAKYQKDFALGRKKPTATAEAPQHLCRARDKSTKKRGYSYDNLMIGLVHKGKCVYASDFASNYITVYKGEWGKSISTGDFEILTEGNDVKWVNTNGKIPQRALALGYRSSFDTQKYGVVKSTDTHLQSIYACRVITRDAKSTVGWTMNGTDCTFLYKGKVTTGWGGGAIFTILKMIIPRSIPTRTMCKF